MRRREQRAPGPGGAATPATTRGLRASPPPPTWPSSFQPLRGSAALPAAGAGDIDAPAPPRLLAALWPHSGQRAPAAARGSRRPALGDPQRSASSFCWAVSAAPRAGWEAREAPEGRGAGQPRLERLRARGADSAVLRTVPGPSSVRTQS